MTPATGQYPPRGSHFAHRFVRLLTKVCIAQEIGPDGCWLLTVIAHTEDAKHYSGPVTFYNEQLMPLCGFGSVDRLIRARATAVASGWLHYETGGKRKPGVYWTLVPPQLDDVPANATDESGSVSTRETRENPRIDRECIREQSASPSTLSLALSPDSCSEPSSTKPSEPPPPAPGFEPFPCAGPIKTWTLPAAKLAEWQACYPALDVPAEIRKARQWCMDNPRKRKTSGGMTRFLGGWLAIAQNNGRGAMREAAKQIAPPPESHRDLTNDPNLRAPAHLRRQNA